ncbi:hypothetical protein [Stomatohabitans albus]|uniref:hypothetical protein n=1 Tax=Stomatohabitans albus TaxID=3110766 RepID=UPI00300D8B62
MQVWTLREDWWAAHTSSDLLYAVQFRCASTADADALWIQLQTDHRRDGATILDGGASIERRAPCVFRVESGGEDALDSLDACLNETVGQALQQLPTFTLVCIEEEQRHEPTSPYSAP